MDTTNHDALITEFCGITQSDPDTARSALESTNWNINEAVTFFFAAHDQPAGAEIEQEDDDDDNDDNMADEEPQQPQRSAQASGSRSSRPPPASSRLRTIRDLQRAEDPSEDEDDENPDLFAGGEKSGLAVQDPNRPSDHFNNIIQQAQQNRPRPGGDDDEPAQPTFFSGRGMTLGGDDAPSTVVEDPRAAAAAQQAQALPRVSRTLHLWQDGFSIDDGELYRFEDPANAHTLALINQGRAPLALLGVQPGQEVDLQLNPHKDEKYVQPKQKYKPFSGGGQRLGSPTPGPSGTASAQPAAPAAAAPASSTAASTPSMNVDESQPTIRLQIRLGDGSRLQSNFNTTHTVGDVHNYINSANQASSSRGYALMTTFPSKDLSDKSVALGDLPEFKRGGVIVQKWT